MHRKLLLLAILLATASTIASAQAKPAASRGLDLQAGVGGTVVASDSNAGKLVGFTLYGTADFTNHFGVELNYHKANDRGNTGISQSSYEFGLRYVRHYGRFHPYVKVLASRPHMRFGSNQDAIGYKAVAFGGGLDINLTRHINARLDAEYQKWLSGPALEHGLTPKLATIGVAYHF